MKILDVSLFDLHSWSLQIGNPLSTRHSFLQDFAHSSNLNVQTRIPTSPSSVNSREKSQYFPRIVRKKNYDNNFSQFDFLLICQKIIFSNLIFDLCFFPRLQKIKKWMSRVKQEYVLCCICIFNGDEFYVGLKQPIRRGEWNERFWYICEAVARNWKFEVKMFFPRTFS